MFCSAHADVDLDRWAGIIVDREPPSRSTNLHAVGLNKNLPVQGRPDVGQYFEILHRDHYW